MNRIGLLVPSPNTTVEPEFYRALPADVTLHVARLCMEEMASGPILDAVRDLEIQSRNLAAADVDVIVLAAAPNLLRGPGYDREVIATIEAVTGKRATTTFAALVQALQHLGIGRVVLGAAYDDKVDALIRSFLEANGVQVVAARGLGLADDPSVGRLEAAGAYQLARAIDRPDAEAIVLACATWKTMDAIERIERELGKPVISTTQAGVWAALRMVRGIAGVQGYGRLLRDLLAPSQQTQLA